MNYGLYLSAAGVLSNMHQQDVYANNLANVNTIAFQPDAASSQQRLPARLEDPSNFADPQRMLEKLGGGILQRETRISFTQGTLSDTGRPLDVAIQGDGFLTVGSPGDPKNWSLTRDGRMTIDTDGELAMASNGMKVLNASGQAIGVDSIGAIEITKDGSVIQNGVERSRLHIVSPSDRNDLFKKGQNLFGLKSGIESNDALTSSDATLMQNHIEQSGVDPVMTLNSMINASRAAKGAAKMMQYHDFTMNLAVNTLGRVR